MIKTHFLEQDVSQAPPKSPEVPIGEIRVKVKLTNATDEALVRRGALPASGVRSLETEALVDTGAVRSVIPPSVQARLGVGSRSEHVAEFADGRREAVAMTEAIIFTLLDRDTSEEALVLGNDVLIGQTILEKLDLLADCANRRVIPNPKHPEGPVSRV